MLTPTRSVNEGVSESERIGGLGCECVLKRAALVTRRVAVCGLTG